MRRRRAIASAVAGVAVVGGLVAGVVVLASGMSSERLDDDQRAIVDELEVGEFSGDPVAAGRFVDANLEVLLSEEVAGAADGEMLVGVFESALSAEGQPERLGRVAAVVAEEGEIHSPVLAVAFADAVAANMDWVFEHVNAPFVPREDDTPEQVRAEYYALHDLLRETMRHEAAAAGLRDALDEHGQAWVAAAPDAGDERSSQLRRTSRVQTFFGEAQHNADIRQATKDRDVDAVDAVGQADATRSQEDGRNVAVWLALDLYDLDPAVRDSAYGRSFVDADGALKNEMTDDEREEFQEWANGLVSEDGPARADHAAMAGGGDDVTSGARGLFLHGRH